MEDKIKDDQKSKWKKARIGLIIFVIFHFFFEVIMMETMGRSTSSIGVPIAVNFIISRWIVKSQISKGKGFENMILTGLVASIGVFAIRLILGTLILSLL